MFRVSQNERELVVDITTADEIERAIRARKAGKYHVDEISADPLPSGHNSRHWGVAIERPDGPVEIQADPWPS